MSEEIKRYDMKNELSRPELEDFVSLNEYNNAINEWRNKTLKYTDTHTFIKKEMDGHGTFNGTIDARGRFVGNVYPDRLVNSINEFMAAKCSDINLQLQAERLKTEKLRKALNRLSYGHHNPNEAMNIIMEALKETEVK